MEIPASASGPIFYFISSCYCSICRIWPLPIRRPRQESENIPIRCLSKVCDAAGTTRGFYRRNSSPYCNSNIRICERTYGIAPICTECVVMFRSSRQVTCFRSRCILATATEHRHICEWLVWQNRSATVITLTCNKSFLAHVCHLRSALRSHPVE